MSETINTGSVSGDISNTVTLDGELSPRGQIEGDIQATGELDGEVQIARTIRDNDYEHLINQPAINGHTLIGDMDSVDDLGIEIIKDDLDVSKTVGGCVSGMHYEEGTTLERIFRDMLNPTEYPTFINPSASIVGSGNHILETGSSTQITIAAILHRGSIDPAYGTSGYRSGPPDKYSFNDGPQTTVDICQETVTEQNNTFNVVIFYEAGEQPKDSKGNDYDSPLPAGSVRSSNLVYEFVDAMWANTASINTIAKLSLVSKSAGNYIFDFPPQTVANPEVFDIPASWTVGTIQVLNEMSGKYEDCSQEFDISNVSHDNAGGVSVAYKRYTDNRGYSAGARKIKVTWS